VSVWILVAVLMEKLVELTLCKEGSETCEEQGKVRGVLPCPAECPT